MFAMKSQFRIENFMFADVINVALPRKELIKNQTSQRWLMPTDADHPHTQVVLAQEMPCSVSGISDPTLK